MVQSSPRQMIYDSVSAYSDFTTTFMLLLSLLCSQRNVRTMAGCTSSTTTPGQLSGTILGPKGETARLPIQHECVWACVSACLLGGALLWVFAQTEGDVNTTLLWDSFPSYDRNRRWSVSQEGRSAGSLQKFNSKLQTDKSAHEAIFSVYHNTSDHVADVILSSFSRSF